MANGLMRGWSEKGVNSTKELSKKREEIKRKEVTLLYKDGLISRDLGWYDLPDISTPQHARAEPT